MNPLEKLVNNKSVAVVGPSPHLQGKKLGQLIDSYDIVCRLNELFPTNLEQDYGSRTDVVFWNLASAAINDFKQMISQEQQITENIKLIVCPRHSSHVEPQHVINHSNNIFKNFKLLNLKNNFFHIGDERNIKLEKEIGCHPTVGTLAISILMSCEIENLYVSGVSFYRTGKRYNDSLEQVLTSANNGVTPHFCYAPPGHNVEKEIEYLTNKIINYKYLKCRKMTGDFFFKNIFNI